jgi:hypothetical protein
MAQHTILQAVALIIIIGCAVLGTYGTLITGGTNGLFETITFTTGQFATKPYIPAGPQPIRTTFTGVYPIDRQLLVLVSFFTFIIDGPQTWDVRLSYWFLMAHFSAGWCLVSLEGLRRGNRGKLLSW